MIMSKKSKEETKSAQSSDGLVATGAAVAPVAYSLTPERVAALTSEAAALGDSLPAFPGRLAQRIRRSGEIRIAAERDADELVRTPFHKAPKLTLAEIHAQRDRIEFLRESESRFQALRVSQKDAFAQFEALGSEAARINTNLLRAFDLFFIDDPKGRKRVSDIRAGDGDPDLVQDVSDVLVLADEHKEYIDGCPRGEAAGVARLRLISPQLSHLLSAKGMSEEATKARKRRDGAYALVMQTEARFRLAAAYWYEGTEKAKDYVAFVAPAKGTPADAAPDDGADAPVAEPAAAPVAAPAAATPPAKPKAGEG
jgi:hypothetical protein